MTIEFFQTKMGQLFYEGTMPKLVKALERVATALEKEGSDMKILVYHGKHGDEYYDISTDTLRGNAYRALFDRLGGRGFYDDSDPDEAERELFDLAAAGDERAVIKFMQRRSGSGYEYEGIEEVMPERLGLNGEPMS